MHRLSRPSDDLKTLEILKNHGIMSNKCLTGGPDSCDFVTLMHVGSLAECDCQARRVKIGRPRGPVLPGSHVDGILRGIQPLILRSLCFCLLILALLGGEPAAHLQAQDFVISEFMAANNSGQRDEDGDFSDWIEIYNPGRKPVSLAGWHLTDDPQQPTQWPCPEVTIPGQGFVLVFASGKDRRNPNGELHANFKLDREGEYLALIKPDGQTVVSAFAPAFPPQITDVAYGRSMILSTERLVPPETEGHLIVPSDDRLGSSWTQTAFDNSTWIPVTLGIGYDRQDASSGDPTEPVTPLSDVTQKGDPIVPTSSNSPGNEGVENAIDNNTATKYLNFDKLNAGLTVAPSAGETVVTGLRFTSANDAPERDPTSFLLAGSQDGLVFSEIARGMIPVFTGRFTTVEAVFTNRVAYRHYRLLFPTVRATASAVAMQIAEIEFLGRIGPIPPTLADLIRTRVEPLMFQLGTSAYVRLPFTVNAVHALENLALRMRYDDGFVAWLNGVEVARANAPQNPAFNSVAVTNRPRDLAGIQERHDLSEFATLIRPGVNVLAIQALNERKDSPDFLLDAQLDNTQVTLGEYVYFDQATPGRENGVGSPGLISDLAFEPPRGFFENPIDVTLSCATSETTLRFTTNGSVPSMTNGHPYVGPIRIDRTTTLRAAAFREGWRSSRVATHTYVFLNDVVQQTRANTLAMGFPANWGAVAADYGLDPRVVDPSGKDKYGGKYARSLKSDLQTIPTLSLVMDQSDLFGPQGLYSNPEFRGDAWERPASLELLYPDNQPGFQANAGIRIQGGAFRRFDLTYKKSFRVVFREKYGHSTLDYPLFGPGAADHFDNIVLRANSNDAWPYFGGSCLYIRDAFAMETARALGMITPHSTFVHLYINGLYWGLYNPVERPDAAFSATYHGGDKDSWDALNQDSAPDGNYEAWNRLLSLLNQGMSSMAAYQRIQGNHPDGTRNPAYEHLLDVDNLIDYMILNFYVGNTDWPGRNWWVGRNRDNGDGFYFYPWDTETALGVTGLEVDRTSVSDAVARPYGALRSNTDFKMQFADRVYRHFFNGGALYVHPTAPAWNPVFPENNQPAARFAALANQIDRAIVGESARWGDQRNTGPFTRDEHWQRERDNLLANFFPRRSSIVLEQFRRAGLYPRTNPPEMNPHGGQVAPGFQLILSAPQGTIYFTTNQTDPRVAGAPLASSIAHTAIPYTAPIPLDDIVTVKARVLNGQEWSALSEATFRVGVPALAITELHYHPANPTDTEIASGYTDADLFEFIELFNPGTATYDLNGLCFTEGIQFDFTRSILPRLAAGQYVLLVKNRAAFEQRYGSGLPIAGEYSGQLSNSGESILLVNKNHETILSFSYGTRTPWPETPDGQGPALERIDYRDNPNSPNNWRASQAINGSPGKPNPVPPLTIQAPALENGTLHLLFEGRAGAGYTVYVRNSLTLGTWQVLERGKSLAANQPVELTFNIATNATSRFFRISIP